MPSKIDLGAYEYGCPDDQSAISAYYQYQDGKPVTACARIGYRNGIAPVAGKYSNDRNILAGGATEGVNGLRRFARGATEGTNGLSRMDTIVAEALNPLIGR